MAQGLSDNGVFDVKIDHTGLIWIGTKTKGVNIIDPNKKRIKYLTSKLGLSNDGITAMRESNEGQMIISNNLNTKKNGDFSKVIFFGIITSSIISDQYCVYSCLPGSSIR